MCGIAGFFGLTGDLQFYIDKMLSKIVHRGPDAFGTWIDPTGSGIVLGHRRLSILDLSENGSQPMVSHSRRYVISYNGEIYNCRYVLEQMRKDGYSDAMRGTSDTEILVEAMAFYGPLEALKMCKGMFAIALLDRETEEIYLARDRVGEKPLYYGYCLGGFVFASEIQAISALPGFRNGLNTDVLRVYLHHGYIPAPYSIYQKIYKLEPGKLLKVKCKINKEIVLDEETYWSMDEVALKGQKNLFKGSREEAATELERLLKSSVKDQMMSDVPLGAFLSAGIDSSTIVSLMQSVSERQVRTFTIGFDDKEYNEADVAAQIAEHLGTDHTQLYVTKQDAIDVVPTLAEMFGEPFADTSQIPTYLVSKLTRDYVTVSLSGDGGDELFGGYRDYAGVARIWNKIGKIPYPVRNIAGSLMEHNPLPGIRGRNMHAHGTLMRASNMTDLYRRTFETDPLTDKLLSPDIYNEAAKLPYYYGSYEQDKMMDPVHTAMLMNLHMYHPDDILAKVDRTAMAVSLESRVPMLDRDIIEFAWTLPLEYIKNDEQGKLILRDVLYKHVPRELVNRPKKGFGVPIAKWLLEGELKEWACELLNSDIINNTGILEGTYVSKLWEDYSLRGIWRPQVWNVLMLLDWLKKVRV